MLASRLPHLVRGGLLLAALLAGGALHGAQAASGHSHARALSGTLRIFSFSYFENPTGQRVIKAYEKLHPGVTIQIQSSPPGDTMIWEKTMLAGGTTAPDIMVPAIYQQEWVDLPKGFWLDVTPYVMAPDPYVPGNKRWYDLIDKQMIESLRFVDGRFFAFPVASNEAAVWYNKDIFSKVGVEVPTTWQQFIAVQQKIKQAGYIPYEFGLGDQLSGDPDPSFMSIIENMVMDATIHKLDVNHDGTIDLKELVSGIKSHVFSPHNSDYQEVWRLMKDWSAYWEPGAAGVSDTGTPFLTGKVAMVYTNPSTYFESLLSKAQIHYGFFRFPQVTPASSSFATPGVKGTGVGGSWWGFVYGLTNAAKARGNVPLAVDFMYYFTAPQNIVALNAAKGQPPVSKAEVAHLDPIGRFFWQVMHEPNRLSFAELALGPSFESTRMSDLQGYVSGKMSLSAAMDDMQGNYDRAAAALIRAFHWQM
jgi:ABC-type glycerol-3-phosphate transport system substrate-binding protein